MSVLLLRLSVFSGALLLGTPVFATKANVPPEQLIKSSELIVVGQVQSHRDELLPANGFRKIYLTVRVESVEKGADIVKPGDTIQAGFQRRAQAVDFPSDNGHRGIPGDGGRAKFFLQSRSGETWEAILPNGSQILDNTPELDYPMEPAAPRTNWPLLVGGAAIGGVATLLMLVRIRRRRSKVPAALT